MGIFKKVKEEETEPVPVAPGTQQRYIDLGSYAQRSSPRRGSRGGRGGRMEVKIAEIDSFEDVRRLSDLVYDGDMLILDFTAIANDELTLKRITTELKRLTEDVKGDLAGVGNNLLLVTPRGIRINRRKIRTGYY